MEILTQQPTETEPYVVTDYPYGFRLRTQIRYWVETTSRGQRFVSQTLNPKTNKWNTPKKGTYSNIILVGKDEKGYISYVTLSPYSLKETEAFFEKYSEYFTDYQKTEYKTILGIDKVYSEVKYSVRSRLFKNRKTGEITSSVPFMTMNDYFECDDEGNPLDREAEDKEQRETRIAINKLAVMQGVKEGASVKQALETFKRS